MGRRKPYDLKPYNTKAEKSNKFWGNVIWWFIMILCVVHLVLSFIYEYKC